MLVLILSVSGTVFADDLLLPASLTSIEAEAFMGDTSLDNVIIPSGVTAIKARTFANSSLRSITIPSSVRSVAADAFAGTDPEIYVEDLNSLSGNFTGRVHLTQDTTISSSLSYSNAALIVDQGVILTVTGSLEGSGLHIYGTVINSGTIRITDEIATYGSGILSIQDVNANTELPHDSFYGRLRFAPAVGVQVNVRSEDKTQTVTVIDTGSNTAEITTGGQTVRFCFIPSASGSYTMRSEGSDDTRGYLYDSSNKKIAENDDIDRSGGNYNFGITHDLTANTVYFYDVQYYKSDKTGTISLILETSGPTEITSHPTDVTAIKNDVANFHVTARGSGLTYQWQRKTSTEGDWEDTTLEGNTTDTLTFKAVGMYDGWQFRCAVTGSDGITVYSDPAAFTYIYSVSLGGNLNHVGTAGERIRLCFIPEKTGIYTLVSTGSTDTEAYLFDASMKQLLFNDDGGESLNFSISYYMTKGTLYFYEIGFHSKSETGRIRMTFTADFVPKIIQQPSNAYVTSGSWVTFTVLATGTEPLSYQWQEMPSGSNGWSNSSFYDSNTYRLGFIASSKYNNMKVRCIITDPEGYRTYSEEAVLTVSSSAPEYRALFIPEVNYSSNPLPGNRKEVTNLVNLLENVSAPNGGAYIPYGFNFEYEDSSPSEILSAISLAFGGAKSNDVSLIYITAHGSTQFASGEMAGSIGTVRKTPGRKYYDTSTSYYDVSDSLLIKELAQALKNIPGKIIIWIDTCGSGSGIYASDTSKDISDNDFDEVWFNQNAIQVFAEVDEELQEISEETGELRVSNKFYVLTAAAHQENSKTRSTLGGYFAEAIIKAIGTSGTMPADSNPEDGFVTQRELYSYVYNYLISKQHAQVYPSNSTYQLFTR